MFYRLGCPKVILNPYLGFRKGSPLWWLPYRDYGLGWANPPLLRPALLLPALHKTSIQPGATSPARLAGGSFLLGVLSSCSYGFPRTLCWRCDRFRQRCCDFASLGNGREVTLAFSPEATPGGCTG